MKAEQGKVYINNEGICAHIIINGKDISKNITEFKLTQKAGERPKLEIVCIPKTLDITLEQLKEIKVKVRDFK